MKRIYYHYLALGSFFGLFALLMLWHTRLSPSTHFPTALILIVVVFPLLLPLRGLLYGRLKSCTWVCYLSLFYLTHGIVEAYTSPTEFYYALLEIVFSLLLCTGAGFYVYKAEKIN